MRPKLMRLLIPVLLLALFVFVMTSDWLLKRPFGTADDVQLQINCLRDDLLASDWSVAAARWQQLRDAWRTIAGRVQFSVERDEINGLTLSLARLRGAILAEDRGGALTELGEAEEHWRDLGR